MKLSGFEMSERKGKHVKMALLLILSKLNKTTIVDIDASLR